MKKYIAPAVECTVIHHESSVMLTSFYLDNEKTAGKDEGEDAGQLTNPYGWDSSNWTE